MLDEMKWRWNCTEAMWLRRSLNQLKAHKLWLFVWCSHVVLCVRTRDGAWVSVTCTKSNIEARVRTKSSINQKHKLAIWEHKFSFFPPPSPPGQFCGYIYLNLPPSPYIAHMADQCDQASWITRWLKSRLGEPWLTKSGLARRQNLKSQRTAQLEGVNFKRSHSCLKPVRFN